MTESSQWLPGEDGCEVVAASVSPDEIRGALVLDLKGCRYSRAEVAVMLSERCGRAISEAQIDAFTSRSKQGHRFPVELLAAWVLVTESPRVLALVCRGGLHLATDTEHDFAEFGREVIESKRAAARRRELRGRLWHKV